MHICSIQKKKKRKGRGRTREYGGHLGDGEKDREENARGRKEREGMSLLKRALDKFNVIE